MEARLEARKRVVAFNDLLYVIIAVKIAKDYDRLINDEYAIYCVSKKVEDLRVLYEEKPDDDIPLQAAALLDILEKLS